MIYLYEQISFKNIYGFLFLKTILILMILIYLLSLIKVSKLFHDKIEINVNKTDEMKLLNDLYKDKITKLENELNNMKNLNLEYYHLINKTLLIERKEFKQNLLNQIN